MPWKRTEPMDQRMRFVLAHEQQLYAMTELCAQFDISTKTGYKWLGRYAAEGPAGLRDRSRAPHACPHRTPPAVVEQLLAVKCQHPYWGGGKIREILRRRDPGLLLPAVSTIDALFAREGLTQPKRRPRAPQRGGAPPLETTAPNQVWTADFKGEFRLGNGRLCFPLTVQDAHSRFLLACVALPDRRTERVLPVFRELFHTYGLPEALRTDNGAPFGSGGLRGHSQLSICCLKLGVQAHRITPGRPTENGRHERMHRTLKAETTRPPAPDLAAQQERFGAFTAEFNQVRPHAALGLQTPAAVYRSSERVCPATPPPPAYPAHFEVRRINQAGSFYFKGQRHFLTEVLIDELVGLTEIEDGLWSIYFYNDELARLDDHTSKIA
jgi:putative transposase